MTEVEYEDGRSAEVVQIFTSLDELIDIFGMGGLEESQIFAEVTGMGRRKRLFLTQVKPSLSSMTYDLPEFLMLVMVPWEFQRPVFGH